MSERCETCRFWKEIPQSTFGTCKHSARPMKDGGRLMPWFPLVEPTYYCFNYQHTEDTL